MNKKVEIWKRKLAKEHTKNQNAVWDRLKQTKPKIRQLSGKWTLEDMEDITATHNMDIESELADILREEIDAEILKSIIDKNT